MSPAFTFFIGLLFLVLFGWYFATDYGLRKRLIATLLGVLLVAFSIATIWPPEKKIEIYKHAPEDNNEKATTERLLVKKKADLGGDRVTESHAYYGNEGWTVQLKFDGEGAKKFGQITEQYKGHRFAIVLDGVIQSAPVIRA